MKTTFKFIIAAIAVISVIASCQKELANETANNSTDGVRMISVQFDNSTKAHIDGFSPKFDANDLIVVSNETKSEVCTLSVSESGIIFTTTLSGKLTAIYPKDAAVLSSNTEGAPIKPSDYIKVSATQDGTISKAIIAEAEIAANSANATFNVKTALFAITPPDTVKTFTITSLRPVVDGVARTGTAKEINTEGDDKCVITVSNDDSTTFYVALVPGVNLSDLSFEYTTDETHGAMKGIPTKDINTDATAANTKYTIGDSNWHPYVKIGKLKWATENIGATDTNPYGTYFVWADTVGHELKESSVGKTGNISSAFKSDYEFSWAKCPFGDGSTSKFKKYVPSEKSSYLASGFSGDTKKVLDLADDAAYVNWGGAWRMPTGGTGIELGSGVTADFTALAQAAKSDYSSSSISLTTTGDVPTSQGVYYYNKKGKTKGVYFVKDDTHKLFFPAAGYGTGTSLYAAGDGGRYWSSTLDSSNPFNAYPLFFTSSLVYPQGSSNRYFGFSVRPVSD